jgi:glycosyltransferase involved in cell wall biosynthesis
MGVEVETVSHQAFRPSKKWDVVHVHHLAEGAVRVASATDRPPFVFTSHDGAVICGYERSRARLSAFGYVSRRADSLVALSQMEARFLDKRYGLGAKATVIPNGVRADVFTLEDHRRPVDRGSLLYVGQLVAQKGVDLLLRALAELPEPRPRLRLAYQDDSQERTLRQLAAQLSIVDCVEFSGGMTPQRLASAYAESDVVVLPSYAEALPNVVTEAMLCGVPVVASGIGGIPEQLGEHGFTFKAGDLQGLVAAIQAALQRRPMTFAQRGALRRHAMVASNLTAMVQRHLALYERVLRGRRSRTSRARNVVDHLVQSAMNLYRRAHPLPPRTSA